MLKRPDSLQDRIPLPRHPDTLDQDPPLSPSSVPPETERKLAAALVILAETIELLHAKDQALEARLAALERPR